MNRVAKAFVVLSLSTAASAAFAYDTGYPVGNGEDTPLSQVFPNLRTYADAHRVDAARSRDSAFPSEGAEQTPLSAEFPKIGTYTDTHQNARVARRSTPTYPGSVNEQPSLADEGLVRGVAGVSDAYGAQGATGDM
jgi:hypothetical protein